MKHRRVQRRVQRNARRPVAERAVDPASGEGVPAPFPTAEADAPKRDRNTGRVLAGNQLARKFPKVDADDPLIAQRLKSDTDHVIEDRGGRDVLSVTMADGLIPRLAFLRMSVESWEQFFLRAGVHTKHGRVRSGYAQYLATLDRYMRLAQLIGIERRPRSITQSPREWLESLTTEAQHHEHHSPHDNGERTPTDETRSTD